VRGDFPVNVHSIMRPLILFYSGITFRFRVPTTGISNGVYSCEEREDPIKRVYSMEYLEGDDLFSYSRARIPTSDRKTSLTLH